MEEEDERNISLNQTTITTTPTDAHLLPSSDNTWCLHICIHQSQQYLEQNWTTDPTPSVHIYIPTKLGFWWVSLNQYSMSLGVRELLKRKFNYAYVCMTCCNASSYIYIIHEYIIFLCFWWQIETQVCWFLVSLNLAMIGLMNSFICRFFRL